MSAGAGYDRAMPEVAFVMSPRQHQSLRELAETLGHELGTAGGHQLAAPGGLPRAAPGPRVRAARSAQLRRRRGCAARCPTTRSWRGPSCSAPSRRRRTPVRSAPRAAAAGGSGVRHRPAGGGDAVAARHPGAPRPPRLHAASTTTSIRDADRPIDVLFLGAHTPRRTRYLDRAARVLARLNVRSAHRAAGAGRERDRRRSATAMAAAGADEGRHQPPLRRADPLRVAPGTRRDPRRRGAS